MGIVIPSYIEEVLDIINKYGEAFIVGGCVRDMLLGLTPHDFDITTDRTPSEIKEIFKDYKIINNNGEKHGTITIFYKHHQIEITTYRVDKDYLDGRHPSEVSFTRNLANDLARRDFTINALAYNKEKGLVDLYGGVRDLESKIIRTVNNPYNRFEEDYLRILRGLRFVSKLNFKMDEETKMASVRLAPKILTYISGERIREELKGILLGKNVLNTLLGYHEVIFSVIPELRPCFNFKQNNPYHDHDVYTHISYVVSYAKKDFTTRLAALLHDIAKPKTYTEEYKNNRIWGHFYGHAEEGVPLARNICNRLKLSNKEKEEVLYLVKEHDTYFEVNKRQVKRLIRRTPDYSYELILKLLDLQDADNKDHINACPTNRDDIIKILKEIKENEEALQIKDLAINGRDLIALGYEGKEIGLLLNEVLNLVLNDKLENKKEDILNYLKKSGGKI